MNLSRASFRKLATHGCAVLALLALTLVIARPICDAYAAANGSSEAAHVAADGHGDNDHSHGDEPGPCCSSIDDASLLGSANVTSASAKPATFVVVPASSRQAWSAVPGRLLASEPPDRPPLCRPYHARTARLLI